MNPGAQTLELLVVLVALAGIGIAGVLAARARRGGSAAEYFLAGRSMGWLPLGVSVSVTMLWALWSLSIVIPSPVGALGWLISGIVAVAGLLVFGLVYAPLYRKSSAASVPAILQARYGRGVGMWTALASILLTLGIRIPLTIFVGTRLLNALLAWDPMSSGLMMIVVPGLLVVAGGYRAVIAIQQASGIAVAAGLAALSLNHGLLPKLPGLDLYPAASAAWQLLLPGAMVGAFWYACVDQFSVQRGLSARTKSDVRSGSWVAAVLVFFGVAALAGSFGSGLLPAEPVAGTGGVAAGFVGAAIIAFGMATLSGHFMSVSTIATMDIVLVNRNKADEAAQVLVGRLSTTVVIFLSILTASSVGLVGTRSFEWMMQVCLVVAPPLAAVVGVGLLWPRLHGRGAFWGIAAGWLAGAVYNVVGPSDAAGMMLGILLGFAISALLFVAVSLVSAPLGVGSSAQILTKGLEAGKP